MLRLEYERHGYTAHIEMFNSKYWNVPQNRDRYAVVGTRNKKNLSFTFPKEQHEFVPKLSDYLEKDVPEKYYLPDEKAQTIIAQAMEKLEKMGKCHACITPDRINKRQKVYIISTLEQITSPVTVKLTNKTTGTIQTVTVTKSQMGFYVTEAGEYTVEADLESVMVTPKAFKVTNDNLMTTQNITLREGSNLGYIGNYIGSFIAQ